MVAYSGNEIWSNIEVLGAGGKTICGQTRYPATPTAKSTNEADGYFITTARPEDFPPDSPFFHTLGLDPSANCSATTLDGVPPFYNVPVLSLTVTSTVIQGDAAPTGPAPASSSSVVPHTTEPPSFPAQTNRPSQHDSPSLPQIDPTEPRSSVKNSVRPEFSRTSTPAAIATIAGSPVVPNAEGAYKVGTSVLIAGGLPLTVSGTVVSLAPSATALIIGSSTISLPKNAPGSQGRVITIGNHPLTEDTQGNYLIAGQTLQPGGSSIGIAGTPFSLLPSATAIFIGSSLIPLSNNAATPPNRPPITIAGAPITADAQGAYVFGTRTLSPGGAPITVSGTPYSLFPSATALLVGSSAVNLQHPPDSTTHNPTITIDGQPITPNPQGEYIIGGQTLAPASHPITISGTPYSLSPFGTALQVGSSIIPLSVSTSTGPMLTVAGHTLAPDPNGTYVVGSQTIRPGGPPVTISGTVVSLGADGRTVVVGGTTEMLASTTTGQGLGSLVWSGIGGGSTDASGGTAVETGTGAMQFTGGANLEGLGVLRKSIYVAASFTILVEILSYIQARGLDIVEVLLYW